MTYPESLEAPPIAVATGNPGKTREIADLLRSHGYRPRTYAPEDLPSPEEDGSTFGENAQIKARATARAVGLLAVADDSGLCVDALDGAPGLLTARWAGRERDFRRGMERLNEALRNLPGPRSDRAAWVCALALALPDGRAEHTEGRTLGTVVWPPRGDGPGFEPIFQPDGERRTAGELDGEERLAIHPRRAAFARLEPLLARWIRFAPRGRLSDTDV